jgi:hypothetical protein
MSLSAARPVAGALALVCVTVWPPRAAAQAPQFTQWGTVKELGGGWTQDVMTVLHSAPMVNPSSCSITTDGYATSAADAGHSLFHTLLLSAFLNRKEVTLGISGCSFNKPHVVAVRLRSVP